MSTNVFDRDTRVLLCPQCGAALDAKPEIPIAKCAYCGANIMLPSRPSPPPSAPAGPVTAESRRLDMLRGQTRQPLMPPPDIRYLMHGGQLSDDRFDEAMKEWQNARAGIAAKSTPSLEEHLYFLTLMLQQYFAKHQDPLRMRALLETALELLTDARYLQEIQGIMARQAARAGETDAAEKWFALCDPYSSDIHVDSAYRFTKAYLATWRGQWLVVLEALGEHADDAPIAEHYYPVSAVLRINAIERLGRLDEAREQFVILMNYCSPEPTLIGEIIRIHAQDGLVLCENSRSAASPTTSVMPAAGKGTWRAITLAMSIVFAIAGAVMLPLYWVRLPFLPHSHDFQNAMLTLGIIALSFAGSSLFGRLMMRAVGAGAPPAVEDGKPGKATIMAVAPTGWSVNDVAQYKLQLRITVDGIPPFEINRKMVLPADLLPNFRPGATIGVRVNPKNPRKVAFDD